jgi:hypothetical protein
VATAEISYLSLEYCEFEDEEAVQVLLDNAQAERGPKGSYFLKGIHLTLWKGSLPLIMHLEAIPTLSNSTSVLFSFALAAFKHSLLHCLKTED